MAISASAIGRLTTARSVEPCAPMFMNAVMIPHTVPNSPMNGVMLAVVARNVTRFSSLLTSTDEARSSARSTAARLFKVGRGAGAPGLAARLLREPKLGGQLGIAGLEHPDQRTERERRADGLHFRELRALAEHLEECRGLLLDPAERPPLVENDPPRNHREEQQEHHHELDDRAGGKNQVGKISGSSSSRRSTALELQCQDKRSRRRQQALRIKFHGECAAGRARFRATVTRHGKYCQTHDTMAVPRSPE